MPENPCSIEVSSNREQPESQNKGTCCEELLTYHRLCSSDHFRFGSCRGSHGGYETGHRAGGRNRRSHPVVPTKSPASPQGKRGFSMSSIRYGNISFRTCMLSEACVVLRYQAIGNSPRARNKGKCCEEVFAHHRFCSSDHIRFGSRSGSHGGCQTGCYRICWFRRIQPVGLKRRPRNPKGKRGFLLSSCFFVVPLT